MPSQVVDMDVVAIEGTERTLRCQSALYEKKTIQKDGKSWTRDYLVLHLDGYGKYGNLQVPTSDGQNSAWAAFNRVFSGSTGRALNGNVDEIFGGKNVSVAKFKITYSPTFGEERDLVVGVAGQEKLPEATPPVEGAIPNKTKDAVLGVLQKVGNANVSTICTTTKLQPSEVTDAIFDMYMNGDIFEPRPGIYSMVEKMPQEPVKSPTIEDRPKDREQTLPWFPFLDAKGTDAKTVENRIAARFCQNTYCNEQQSINHKFFVASYNLEAERAKVRFVLGVLKSSGKIAISGDDATPGEGYTAVVADGTPVIVQKVPSG